MPERIPVGRITRGVAHADGGAGVGVVELHAEPQGHSIEAAMNALDRICDAAHARSAEVDVGWHGAVAAFLCGQPLGCVLDERELCIPLRVLVHVA